MENNDMILLNGRTRSDYSGVWTFIGPNGQSVIDLVWVDTESLNIISDLEIRNLYEKSRHNMCSLTLTKTFQVHDKGNRVYQKFHTNTTTVIKWNEEKNVTYQIALSNSLRIYFNSSSTEQLYDNLIQAIYEATDQTNEEMCQN